MKYIFNEIFITLYLISWLIKDQIDIYYIVIHKLGICCDEIVKNVFTSEDNWTKIKNKSMQYFLDHLLSLLICKLIIAKKHRLFTNLLMKLHFIMKTILALYWKYPILLFTYTLHLFLELWRFHLSLIRNFNEIRWSVKNTQSMKYIFITKLVLIHLKQFHAIMFYIVTV